MTEFYAAGKRFPLNRTYVMGILNVTPDSFSDGGKYFDPEKAVRHAVEMEAQGVDILTCGTCLDYYHRKEKLLVGGITNMYSIVETLEKADVVVKP